MKNKKIRFFQSVNLKIALSFALLLMISIEIIGAIFLRELETSTVRSFKNNMNDRVESLNTNISSELAEVEEGKDNTNLHRTLSEFAKSDVLEARIVDNKGIVIAVSDANKQYLVGKKNDLGALSGAGQKREEIRDEKTNERKYVNVEQIYSASGDVVIGVLYVQSDIESKYQEVSNIATIFFWASNIALIISLGVAVLVSRTITKPIEEMRQQAARIAQGDYSGKITVYGRDELGQLAETINELTERIEETQETMEAESNRLDSVLAHMSDGVLATDRRGKIIMLNDKANLLLDLNEEEAIGRSILELLPLKKGYTLRRLLQEEEDMILDFSKEREEPMVLRAEFSMIRRDSGFISGIVCVLHDITEQQKIDQERRDFVSNVSHELRTPLTSMHSYLESLIEGAWQDPDVAPDFLHVTQEETERMIRMINDLLALSRMDSKRDSLRLELVNFNELLNFILDRFDMMVRSQNKNYTIVREFTKRSLWVDLDADKMIQVVDNILNNAMKYSPMGGTITVRLLETHNHVILSVTDQGLGIPKKDLGKVFDRFYRVDKARSREMGGSGLGLAISKEVIQGHGGSVWVESQEGKGSTFYISLPYEPYEEDLWE